jgi:hypothetical protein
MGPFSALIIGRSEYRRVGRFLRFVGFFALLVAFLGLVVVPLIASPILTGMVRDMGLRSDTLRVSVELFDPLLFVGRARAVHVTADSVDVSPAGIGSMDLTLGGVSFLNRDWQTVNGELRDVSLETGGERFVVGSVRVSGEADAADATARLTGPELEGIVRFAAARQGVTVDEVSLDNAGVRVVIGGIEGAARVEVRGGALVLIAGPQNVAVPLLQPQPSDAWRLEETWISDDAVNVRGVVDTTRLASVVTG